MSYKAKVAFENNEQLETVICKAFSHKDEMLQEIARDELVESTIQDVLRIHADALQMLYDGDHIGFKRRKYEGSST
jgi:hypothetical protein